jgi:hypothetical protein
LGTLRNISGGDRLEKGRDRRSTAKLGGINLKI